MIHNMYSIYDTLSEVFNKPFMEHNDKSAIRAFSTFMTQPEQINQKNDFALYHVGAFDDNKGVTIPNSDPVKIYTGFDIKENNVKDIKRVVSE